MKRITSSVLAGFVALMVLAMAVSAFAEAETMTITGMGKCAKCALHQTDKCQNVVEVEKDGKTTTYWLVGDKSKAFHHDNLCKESKKVTATGKVEEKDGKMVMTVTEIKAAD
jgi:Family of unknown function (DUF6370)